MKEKLRGISHKLDLYIETKRFRWLRSLIIALGFTVTGCVCFLAGFFLNRDDNMIYKSRINAAADMQHIAMPETVGTAAAAPVPDETAVTETAPPRATISEQLLDSYISDDINIPDTEYTYTDTASFENRSTINGVKLPFTKKSFTLSYSGSIYARVDSSLITAYADNDTYTIYVTLPEAHIVSHVIDEKSFSVSGVNDNIFNPITPQDYMSICKTGNEKNENAAIVSGLIDRTYEEAQKVIRDYLNRDGIISSMYTTEFILP